LSKEKSPAQGVILEELNEDLDDSVDLGINEARGVSEFSLLEDQNWSKEEKNMMRKEKRRAWKDLDEIYNIRAGKLTKSKKKRGRRRLPKDIELVVNEEEIIAEHNEILRHNIVQIESLEARPRRVWNIGKQMGLRSKGKEESAIQLLKEKLAEQ
jgi:hypothetical protein